MNLLVELGENAKKASKVIAQASAKEKSTALQSMAQALLDQKEDILAANKRDTTKAEEQGIAGSFLDRLVLDEKRITSMADGLKSVADFKDPIGYVNEMWTNEAGLQIGQTTVPLGVVGMIYEARPNVTADAAGLAFKAGNAIILRGGKEAIESNKAIAKALQGGLSQTEIPETTIQLIEDTSREVSTEFMKLSRYLDVLIPRGSAGLINAVLQNAAVPVIETGTGNVHVYVDESAAIDMAVDIVVNSKTQRTSVCNAAESLLVHENISEDFLPALQKGLAEHKVELRADEKSRKFLDKAIEVSDEDYYTEFLDLVMSVKTVGSVDEAIDHINQYSTGHSESIVTKDYASSQKFLKEVDSSTVYVNASTRFTDGGEFGFGGEIGISTQKLHARGPMGVNALTSTKYIVYGNGQIRD